MSATTTAAVSTTTAGMTAATGRATAVVRRLATVVGRTATVVGRTIVGRVTAIVRRTIAWWVAGRTAVVAIVVAAVIAAATAVDIAVIIPAARATIPVTSPTVVIAPVGPGSYAEEDAVVEVAGAVVAIGRARVRRVVVVAIRAPWRRSAADVHANGDLRGCRCGRDSQAG